MVTQPNPSVSEADHRDAVKALADDPTNADKAARVVDNMLRDPKGATSAHQEFDSFGGAKRPGELDFDNLAIPQPAGAFSPRSVEELAGLMQEAADKGLPIKPIGAAYALSDLDGTAGYLLNLGTHLTGVRRAEYAELKAGNQEILYEVQAGASIDQVNRALWSNGHALHNQPGYEGLTLVGVASVGGHGSGQQLVGIAESLRAIRLLGFDDQGRVRRWQVEPTDGITDPRAYSGANGELLQDDDAFYSARVGLGALGVIASVVVSARPSYYLREDRTFLEWPDMARRIAELRQPAPNRHSFAIWLNPYRSGSTNEATCLLSTYTEVPGPAHGERGLGIIFGGLDPVAHLIVWWVSHFPKALPGLMDSALRSAADSDVVMPCTEALNFGPPNHLGVTASACGIAANDAADAGDFIVALARKFAAEQNSYITSPVGFRFVAAAKSYLSPQYGRDTCMIEVPMLGGTPNAARSLDEFQDTMAVRFGARAHWGQRLTTLEARARQQYPKFDVFRQQRNRFGATNHFTNDRIHLLGLDT
jgi:L-gulono-1,4-lactone dehydrogenase